MLCTLQGEDLFLEGLGEEHRAEAKALIRQHADGVDGFVATSDYYADFMASYLGLDRRKIHTVPIGINLDGHSPRPAGTDGPFVVGYFARVAPEKGLHLLAEAYRILRQERGLADARLEVGGYLAPEHRPYLDEIRARLREWGLESEFRYHGTVDREAKVALLQSLDVLSVPSPYAEPKGLYVLEALANGVPCVQPRHGAFPEVLGPHRRRRPVRAQRHGRPGRPSARPGQRPRGRRAPSDTAAPRASTTTTRSPAWPTAPSRCTVPSPSTQRGSGPES